MPYDQIEKSVNDDSYRFTVEGVGKPGEYTLDDLKAMPQTEFTAASTATWPATTLPCSTTCP